MTPSEFADQIWKRHGTSQPFSAFAEYDPDGDCLEFIAADEAFVGERVDKWVTVYRGRDSGEVVGSLIKNVKELLSKNPGLAIEIRSGPVCLSHILLAPKFSATSELSVRIYRQIIQKADALGINADLQYAVN